MVNREKEIQREYVHDVKSVFDHVFIDVDSCVSGIEGIDELARIHHCIDGVEQLTRQAMNGEVQFEDVFAKRLNYIQPHRQDLTQISQMYIDTVTPQAREVIQKLQSCGAYVWLLSGGYDDAIIPLAEFLGIDKDRVLANHLEFDQRGVYKDYDRENPLCRQSGKRLIIEKLKHDGKIGGKITIIGDGMSEIEAKGIVDMCIGFGGHIARDKVKNEADVFVKDKTFLALEPILFE